MTVPATQQPPTPPTPPPGDQPPPAGGTPPAGPPAGDVEPPNEPSWLKGRLDREKTAARAAMLRELGYSDAEAAKQAKQELETIKAERETARLAALNESEREKERSKTLEAELAAERKKLSKLERESALNGACAQLGVKNTGYAAFLFRQARDADPKADATAVLTQALTNEQNRAALGAGAVPVVTVPTGDTSPPVGGPAPAPGPGGGAPFDALKADDSSWLAYKAGMGGR